MHDTPTPLITRRDFDTWLHNQNRTDREKTSEKTNGHSSQEEDETYHALSRALRFTWPDMDGEIRKSRPTLKELLTVRRALNMTRLLATFVFCFAMINMIVVVFGGAYDIGSRAGFLRFGMTVPASLSVMCNAISVFLLSHLVEKIYVSKLPPNG